MPQEPIIFKDMAARESEARQRLEDRVFVLEQLKDEQGGKLEPILQKELKEIYRKLKEPVLDPLYRTLQKAFEKTNQPIGPHQDGMLPSQYGSPPAETLTADETAGRGVFVASMPPTRSTRPSKSRVAVCALRAVVRVPASSLNSWTSVP